MDLRVMPRVLAFAVGLGSVCLATDYSNDLTNRVRTYSINYDTELPNFLCTETVRRFDESNDPRVSAPNWQPRDTIGIQLTYFEGHETYKVLTLNGKALLDTSLETLGGNWTSGEFGTLLKGIFRSASHARFDLRAMPALNGFEERRFRAATFPY